MNIRLCKAAIVIAVVVLFQLIYNAEFAGPVARAELASETLLYTPIESSVDVLRDIRAELVKLNETMTPEAVIFDPCDPLNEVRWPMHDLWKAKYGLESQYAYNDWLLGRIVQQNRIDIKALKAVNPPTIPTPKADPNE